MGRLTLTLRPNERFLIGGCLVENGPKRSAITIMDEATYVLRLSDALHPDEVTTPVRRAYYAAQLVLACEETPEEALPVLTAQLNDLAAVFADTPCLPAIERSRAAGAAGRFHGVLMALKPLLAVEDDLLSSVAPREKAIATR